MIRLSKNLYITAVIDVFCIILLLLARGGNQGAGIMDLSLTRLVMFVMLGLFLGLLIWIIRGLHKDPFREQKIQQNLLHLMQKSWIGKAIQFVAAAVIVLVIMLSLSHVFVNSFPYRRVFLRPRSCAPVPRLPCCANPSLRVFARKWRPMGEHPSLFHSLHQQRDHHPTIPARSASASI